jgi:hypothetical protein
VRHVGSRLWQRREERLSTQDREAEHIKVETVGGTGHQLKKRFLVDTIN